jgi:pimeloyl-ACP methyl ester carboxylesterase
MLHYTQAGEGNVIVLLHGFCESNTCFSEQVFFLSKNYRIITPDLPGFGKSDVIQGASISQWADEIKKVLDKEQVSQCLMMGHSMGGYVTLAFAKKYASRLKGIGLLNSTALADSEERKEKREQTIGFIQSNGVSAYVRSFIPPLFHTEFKDNKIIESIIQEASEFSAEGIVAALQAMKQRDESTKMLEQISLPVLFLAGKYDSLIPYPSNIEQAVMCKKAEICLTQHSAHMSMLEEPSVVNNAIKNFAEACFV